MQSIRKPLYPVFSPGIRQCAYHILQRPHSLNPTEDLDEREVPLKFTSLSSVRQNTMVCLFSHF